MSLKPKCHQNAIVIRTKCHQTQISSNVTKTQMSPKRKCHQNANVPKHKICVTMSPKHKCHQNVNVTKTQISPLELTFVYLPNGSGKNRSPDLITINPNGLPGHGLCYSRLVLHSILSRTILTVIYVGPQNCFIGTTDSFIKNHTLAWTKTPKL
jgi:hypothetical protein